MAKKFINKATDVVSEMLQGIVAVHPQLHILDQKHLVIIRSDIKQLIDNACSNSSVDAKVVRTTLISGGGSGHEPSHAGYVGEGMLSASVCGQVFASPPVGTILAAIRACTTCDGRVSCLLIVKNYTGDRLNFRLAAQMAQAEGRVVDMVLVDDDAATGSRGIAGTVLVHKITGAAAHEGLSLDDVKQVALAVIERVRTIGVSLGSCFVPGNNNSAVNLKNDEMEIGLGIHGEQGVKRAVMKSAKDIVATLWDDYLPPILPHTPCIVMINNLGATTAMELYIIAREVMQLATSRQVDVKRILVGSFMTALEMPGFSLSVIPLDIDDTITLSRLDAPVSSSCFGWTVKSTTRNESPSIISTELDLPHDIPVISPQKYNTLPSSLETPILAINPSFEEIAWLDSLVTKVCQCAIENEKELTELDLICGDGDLGHTLARIAQVILAWIQRQDRSPIQQAHDYLEKLSWVVLDMGGSSGPFYSTCLFQMAQSLKKSLNWGDAWLAGINGIKELGGAKAGDRTMLDALIPLAEAMNQQPTNINNIAKACERGAESTKHMKAATGRSQYIANDKIAGHRDPGAHAIALFVNYVAKHTL